MGKDTFHKSMSRRYAIKKKRLKKAHHGKRPIFGAVTQKIGKI